MPTINPMDLTGRTVLVTGASSGIGRETAILLAALGARIILTARRAEELDRTLGMMESGAHVAVPFDLAGTTDAIPDWISGLARQHGALNGLAHCAGMEKIRPLRFATATTFKEVLELNLVSAFALAKGWERKGVAAPNASLVFVSSISGLIGQAGSTEYCASKGGLNSLVRALAMEMARSGLRVNCVAPGLVQTELADRVFRLMTPEQAEGYRKMHLLGIGAPRDVANAIAFLIADTGRWITGSTLVVDGGYTTV